MNASVEPAYQANRAFTSEWKCGCFAGSRCVAAGRTCTQPPPRMMQALALDCSPNVRQPCRNLFFTPLPCNYRRESNKENSFTFNLQVRGAVLPDATEQKSLRLRQVALATAGWTPSKYQKGAFHRDWRPHGRESPDTHPSMSKGSQNPYTALGWLVDVPVGCREANAVVTGPSYESHSPGRISVRLPSRRTIPHACCCDQVSPPIHGFSVAV